MFSPRGDAKNSSSVSTFSIESVLNTESRNRSVTNRRMPVKPTITIFAIQNSFVFLCSAFNSGEISCFGPSRL